MTLVDRRRLDATPFLTAYALALGPPRLSAVSVTMDYCQLCGELRALHQVPCQPGVCVAKGCDEPQTVNELGLCHTHMDVLASQRAGRSR